MDGFEWTTDFDGVVRVGGRETQDTCCGVDLANVSYGHWFDLVLARLGCCTILVGNGVVDYRGHCSIDVRPRKMRRKDARENGRETLHV